MGNPALCSWRDRRFDFRPPATVFVALVITFVAASIPASPPPDAVERWAGEHVRSALEGGLEPIDFHHIYLALEYRQAFSDWRVAEKLLDRLSASPAADPLMIDVVRFYRARLALDEGHPAASLELFRTMGGLTRWWVSDPLDLEELQDFDRVAILPNQETVWRFVPGVNSLGWLQLEGLAWPARRQMLTLAVNVSSDTRQPVAIRLGAAQVARAWLNSEQILTTDYPLRAAEDQVAGGGWLRDGTNTLVVSVASETADWWLRVRLTAPDGSPLRGVRELDQKPEIIAPVRRDRPEVHSLEERLRRDVERGKPEARLALAGLLVRRNSEPKASGAAREACREARDENLALASLFESLVTSEPGQKRDLLIESLSAGGPPVPVRTRLARWYFERDLFEQAHAVLADYLDTPAVRATALDLDTRHWGPTIFNDLKDSAARFPNCLDSLTTLATWALEFGRWNLLEQTLEQALSLAPGLPEVEQLASLAAGDCGDGERLREILKQQLKRNPNRAGARIRLARMEAAEDRIAEAERLLARGLQRCPGHVELLMETAHLAHRAGREEAAADAAREVLLLRPQNRSAEQLLGLLGKSREEDAWRLPPEDLWALAATAEHLPGSHLVLLDHTAIRFLPGNLTEEKVQRVFLVRKADQSQVLETHYLPYVPETQRLRVLAARLLRPDGSQVGARRRDSPRLSEPEFNIYYDTRLRILHFDDLEDGNLIELAYVLTETAEANETGAYEGNILRLGHSSPTLRTEVELSGSEEQMPAWELVLVQSEPERQVEPDGSRRLRWAFSDLPAIPDDLPKGPNLVFQPHLVYSNHPSWGDLAGWYSRHVAPRIRASRQVEETARRLIEGAENRNEKIARIYRFVTDKIRYVGLEFGEHRFRPFSADWVLSHRMGDCKDTAGLLVALFSSIGVPARMAMVRTSDLGPVSAEMALLEDFNHAIAYLPEDDLWLDGTAAGHDVFPPPGVDQNAWVLVIDGPRSKPRTSPVPGAGRYRSHYTLTLGEDERYELLVRTEDTGEAATIRRGRFGGSRNPTLFARWLQQKFPGAELVGEPQLVLAPGKKVAVMEVRAVIDRMAAHAGGGLKVYPGTFGLDEELTPSETRSSPLLLPVRPDLEWILEVHSGRPPQPLPDPVHLKTPYGELKIQTTAETDGFRVEGSFRLQPMLVPAAEAGQVRQFLVATRHALEKTLEIP
ncbi:MAG: DUF3857 domain-containing protein [Thermoanaerobaculales bacterium]|nr:DUF3857 domain-containing protein [Thermoanaerobaculales bacterium]